MVDWTVSDAEELRAYLGKTKNKLIDALRERAPDQLGDKFEQVALSAKENLGWHNCIKTIVANAVPNREHQSSSEHVDVTQGLVK